MNLKQISIKSFFKRKSGNRSESEASSSDESEYVLSKQKSMFAHPMSWTRIREVYSTIDKWVSIFDVEDDLKQDKVLKAIRKAATRELGELLFDPNTFNDMIDQLTMADYKLEEEKLEEYAKLSSTIRLEISQKVSALAEE